MSYKVVIDDTTYELSIDQIYELRDDPLLIHCHNEKGDNVILSYEEFSALDTVSKVIAQLELLRNTNSKRGGDLNPKTPTSKSTMDHLSFLKLATSLVPKFTDNAEELDFFVDQVTQLREATPANLQTHLLSFVKGRLSGKARTAAKDSISLDDVIASLREEIQLESSEILESKLAALRFDYKNLTEFATAVENTSDQLIASLISEGVRKDKAKQMTTKLVVDTCKNSSRNQHVKTVMAAGNFSSPREALTKFRSEMSDSHKDTQFLIYQSRPPHHTYNRSFNNNSYWRDRASNMPNNNRNPPVHYNNSNFRRGRNFRSNGQGEFREANVRITQNTDNDIESVEYPSENGNATRWSHTNPEMENLN